MLWVYEHYKYFILSARGWTIESYCLLTSDSDVLSRSRAESVDTPCLLGMRFKGANTVTKEGTIVRKEVHWETASQTIQWDLPEDQNEAVPATSKRGSARGMLARWRSLNAASMLAHCLRRWPSIAPTLGECSVFAMWAFRIVQDAVIHPQASLPWG